MNYKVIEPKDKAQFSVIWLHGLGSNGNDFVFTIDHLDVTIKNIRFIFPNADVIPVTINMGMHMRAWYDIKALDTNSINRIVDIQGINCSIKKLKNIIDEQINQGIPSENIILAGFSQGGVIVTYTTILSKCKFAGLIGLSTYLPGWNKFKNNITKVNTNTPILLCHGTNDNIIPEILGQDLSYKLNKNGFNNKYKNYSGMKHSVCIEEIKDISKFIAKAFNI